MKRVLTAVLLVVGLVSGATYVSAQMAHGPQNLAEVKWGPAPNMLPAGAEVAVLFGDPSKAGPFAIRLKFPANYNIPAHSHPTDENVTVTSGTFFVGMGEKFDQGSGKELPVGGFVSVPATHRHFAWAGDQETIVQVHGVGPTDITFVNPADDPRKK